MKKIKLPIRFPYALLKYERDTVKESFEQYIETEEFTKRLNHDEIKLSFSSNLGTKEHVFVLSPVDYIGTVVDISYVDDVLTTTVNVLDIYTDDTSLIDILEHGTNAVPVLTLNYVDGKIKVINVPVLYVSAYVNGQACSTLTNFNNIKYANVIQYTEPVRLHKK